MRPLASPMYQISPWVRSNPRPLVYSQKLQPTKLPRRESREGSTATAHWMKLDLILAAMDELILPCNKKKKLCSFPSKQTKILPKVPSSIGFELEKGPEPQLSKRAQKEEGIVQWVGGNQKTKLGHKKQWRWWSTVSSPFHKGHTYWPRKNFWIWSFQELKFCLS